MNKVVLQDAFTFPVKLFIQAGRVFKGISQTTFRNSQKFVEVRHVNLHYRRMWKKLNVSHGMFLWLPAEQLLVQHCCPWSHMKKTVCSLLRTVPIMFCFPLVLLFFSGNGSVGLTYCKSVSLFCIYPSLFFFFLIWKSLVTKTLLRKYPWKQETM